MASNEQIILDEYTVNRKSYINVARKIVKDQAAAEDIVQDALMTALDKAETFDPKRRIKDWFFVCVKNQALIYLRKTNTENKYVIKFDDMLNHYHRTNPIDAASFHLQKDNYSESNIIKSEEHTQTITALSSAFEALPVKMKKSVQLHYLEGMRGKQVSKAMGCGQIAAAASWVRGINKMKKSLAEKDIVSYSLIDVLL